MTRPGQISTFDNTATDGLVWWSCVISKSLRMRRLVCAFVVRKTPQDSFLISRPIWCFLNIKKSSTQVLMYSIQNTRIVDKHVLHLEMKNLFLDSHGAWGVPDYEVWQPLTLIRFINYFRRHHWLEHNVHLHLRGLSENSFFLYFYYFRRRIVDAILTIAIECCFPMPWEDRNEHDQIEHMLTLILAKDIWWSWPFFSLNISPPPPPPPKKKSLWTRLYCMLHACTTLSSVIKIYYVVSSLAFIVYLNIWL